MYLFRLISKFTLVLGHDPLNVFLDYSNFFFFFCGVLTSKGTGFDSGVRKVFSLVTYGRECHTYESKLVIVVRSHCR